MRWLVGITDSMDMSLSRHQEILEDGRLACAVRRVAKSPARLRNDTGSKGRSGHRSPAASFWPASFAAQSCRRSVSPVGWP